MHACAYAVLQAGWWVAWISPLQGLGLRCIGNACMRMWAAALAADLRCSQPTVLAAQLSASHPSPAPPTVLPQAPEVLEGGRATAASDVFSFGVVMYEALLWRLPWAGTPPLQASGRIRLGEGGRCSRQGTAGRAACCGNDSLPHGRVEGRCTEHNGAYVTAAPHHCSLWLQIMRLVTGGARPEVPPVDALPGPPALPALVEAYCALMR